MAKMVSTRLNLYMERNLLQSYSPPRNISPIDMIWVPLVVQMIGAGGRVIHHSARILNMQVSACITMLQGSTYIHPSSRRDEMVGRSPSGEEAVIAQTRNNVWSEDSGQ